MIFIPLQSCVSWPTVVYDECTADLQSLSSSQSVSLVMAALEKMGKCPFLLQGLCHTSLSLSLSLSLPPSFLSLSLPLQERYLVFFLHASVLHPHTTTYMCVHIVLSGSTYSVYGKMGSVPCVHVAGSTWVEGKALGQSPSVRRNLA